MKPTCTPLVLSFCIAAGSHPAWAQDHSSWTRVTDIKRGSVIVLEVRGALPATRHFVSADDSELIVLNVDHPMLPRDARDSLLETASARPELFRRLGDGVRFMHGRTRLGADGVFVSDNKIAELGEVVQRVPREEVAAIRTPPRRRYSAVGAVGGAVAGGVIGYRVAGGLAYTTNKNAVALMGVALVGFPIGGAVLGAHAGRGVEQRVIYRAP